jgi:hypothetical protein
VNRYLPAREPVRIEIASETGDEPVAPTRPGDRLFAWLDRILST